MPSRDILDKLFTVERNAQSLVSEAGTEAESRITAAKESAEAEFRKVYEQKVAVFEKNFADFNSKNEAEYRAALDSYRVALESSPENRSAFNTLLDELLSGKA